MNLDGQMNTAAMEADAQYELLHAENYKLKRLVARMADELIYADAGRSLVREAKELIGNHIS